MGSTSESTWMAALGRNVSGAVARIDAASKASIDNPLAVVQLALTSTLVLSAVVVLTSWVADVSDPTLRIPILVLGLSIVGLAITINKGGAAVTLSILIVGILVAPREYLLRIAHMISHSAAPFGDYAKTYEGETTEGTTGTTEELASRVIDVLKQRGVELTAEQRKAVGVTVTSDQLTQLSSQVRRQDADFPLKRLVEGGAGWDDFRTRYADLDIFHQAMSFLRDKGLVTFTDRSYRDAAPTSLGRQVNAALVSQRLGTRSGLENVSDPTVFDSIPQANTMQVIQLGTKKTFKLGNPSLADWLRFRIPSAGTYVIDVHSEDSDPHVALFGPDKTLIETNDDAPSSVRLDSHIETRLRAGEHYLGVAEVSADSMVYEVHIRRRAADTR